MDQTETVEVLNFPKPESSLRKLKAAAPRPFSSFNT
jgi:hypothetical protein